MTFEDFWAGATEHLLDAPTRRALKQLSMHNGSPSLAEIQRVAASLGAKLGPVAAAFGYLPRLNEEGYYLVSDRNRFHAVLDTNDVATLACFAFWRHLGRPLYTKILATNPAMLRRPFKPDPAHFGLHPYAADND